LQVEFVLGTLLEMLILLVYTHIMRENRNLELVSNKFSSSKIMEIVNGVSFPNFAHIFKVEEQVFYFMTMVL
jgi:hypothetical protein